MNIENIMTMLIFALAICVPIVIAITQWFKKSFKFSGTIVSTILSVVVPCIVSGLYIWATETQIKPIIVIGILVLCYACWISSQQGYKAGLQFVQRLMSILKGNIPTDDDYPTVGNVKDSEDETESEDEKDD